MKQKDILNGLFACSQEYEDCKGCPYRHSGCVTELVKDSANEINRLQAELLLLQSETRKVKVCDFT